MYHLSFLIFSAKQVVEAVMTFDRSLLILHYGNRLTIQCIIPTALQSVALASLQCKSNYFIECFFVRKIRKRKIDGKKGNYVERP